jgi:hypothetical protein
VKSEQEIREELNINIILTLSIYLNLFGILDFLLNGF